jgi:probable rRNA maturation factor
MTVFFSDEQSEPADAGSLRRFAELVLELEGFPGTTELAILLVGADQMAEYNQRFMGREGPTDVLAFPLEDLEPGRPPKLTRGEPPVTLGDVFLCPVEVGRRARRERIPYDDFLYLLLAHGILHLMGYQHDEDDAAEQMERREDELLAAIGRDLP